MLNQFDFGFSPGLGKTVTSNNIGITKKYIDIIIQIDEYSILQNNQLFDSLKN